MTRKKSSKACIIGIFRHDLVGVDVCTSKVVDPACLAKSIGIDENHSVKAKITLEIVEEPCELCGKLATGDQICQECGKLVCDQCAKTDSTKRYCPACFAKMKSLLKLV